MPPLARSALLAALLVAACDSPQPVAAARITLVGYWATTGGPRAYLWTDGVVTELPGIDGGWVEAYGLALDGDAPVVVGACATADGTRACVHRGGAWTVLAGGGGYSEARAVVIAGGATVVGGWITDFSTGYAEQMPCVWTDGVVDTLRDSDGLDRVYALAVDGADVYAAGDAPTTSGEVRPALWKNGTLDRLGSDAGTAWAVVARAGAAIAGGAVAGPTATLWRDGDPEALGAGTIHALAWDGDALLAVGGDPAQLWRDGAATTLDDAFAAAATAVAASGGAWVAAGTWGGAEATVCVWDATGRRDLFTRDNAVVTAMVVQP